jgi:hypothetical protein
MAGDSTVRTVERTRMVRVASTRDGFEARVIAARLGAEGFVWELRGAVDGPYPVGPVDVLVEEDAADDARELLAMELDPLELEQQAIGDV